MTPTPEPSAARRAAVFGGGLVGIAALYLCARALGPSAGPLAIAGSVLLGIVAATWTGSLGEWCVHRYLMHRPLTQRRPGLAYELHHVAHHWVQFPPDEYLQLGTIHRVPARGWRSGRVCATALGRAAVIATHLAFYSVFALVLAVLPGFLLAQNAAFAWSLTGTTALFLFLFVHVHDAVHQPGYSPLERFGWFWFLDRHHYVHHVDTAANTNFLLPLGDWLLGTLRRELSAEERQRWPSHAQARAQVLQPRFSEDGAKLPPAPGTSSAPAYSSAPR